MRHMSGTTRRSLLVAATAAIAAPASAQSWPAKTVKIVVPFGPGGPADVYARVIGNELGEVLKQQFVIDNKPGAGALIGTDIAAKSAPDGYTLLMMSNTHTVNETLLPKRPYVLLRDLVPVSPVNSSDLVMVVHPSVAAKTLAEFIALAKAQPGKLAYASSGPGTPYHMAGELFKAMSGTDLLHVPHKGSAEARNAVLGGHVQMMFDAVTAMKGSIDAGNVRARHHRDDAFGRSVQRADGIGGRPAGLRGHDLARHHGAGRHAQGHRRAAQCRDRQDHRQAGDPRGLGQAGRRADGHDARCLRRVHEERHREVGEADRAGRHQDAMSTVRIFSGGAAHGLVESLRPAFEAQTGCTIDGTFSAVGAMKARVVAGVGAGEPADLVILTRALIAELARNGHVAGATAADLGTIDTAIAVRAGDPPPPVGDASALRAALLASDAIHFPDPEQATAGIHFAKVLRDLGISDAVAGRLKTAPNGATAMRALAESKDKRPIGCTQATEILSTPGIVLVAPLPKGCDLATVYTAAVGSKSQAPDAARRLVTMLTDAAGREARRRLGFA